MKLRLTIIALLLTTLTAGAWTQQMLMREAYARRGAAPVAEIGNAVDLDGLNEYFTDPSTNFLNGITSVTFSAWVNLNSLTFSDAILVFRDTANNLTGIALEINTSYRYQILVGYDGTASKRLRVSDVATTGEWQHVVGVCTMGVQLALYVNGVGYYQTNTSPTLVHDNYFYLARDPASSGYKINGKLDESAIWTRALTSNEVVELYNNGLGKRSDQLSTGTNGLVRLWHLDESGSSSNAYDSASGTTATGTAIGSGDWVTGKVPK